MELQVLDKNNKKVSQITLGDGVDAKVSKKILYYAVKAARNSLRRGTAAVKDRSDVNKTNKKIYRQKGTGNARHAARGANIFVGGGSAHGPHPRSYVEGVSKTFKKRGLQETFRYLIQENKLKILNEIVFDKPTSKGAALILENLGLTKALVILDQGNVNAVRSFRNLKNVGVIHENNVNLYDMLRYDNVVMTEALFATVKERYGL